MSWRRFWFGALTLLALVEAWAIARPAAGDTLSEQVMPMLSDPLVWTGTLSVWIVVAAWLTWHWWFDR